MKTWTILYRQTEYRNASVEAETEREARRKFREGDFNDQGFEHAENARIETIEEEAE